MVSSTTKEMKDALLRQRHSFLREGTASASVRKDRLQRLIRMMLEHQDDIVTALQHDFGDRSAITSKAAEILSSVGALNYALQSVDEWTKPEPRALVPETHGPGARAEIHYQPLGVVGTISPWNAPFLLGVGPLAGIISAGNRAMIKPSELTPASSELLKAMVGEFFDPTELIVFTGGQEVGDEFSRLPFDHLMFTGSERVARQVMRNAAENLVPVTLELGGKSPVVIGSGYDIGTAATRITHGKLLNAGQICIAPDYVFVPEGKVDAFVKACIEAASSLYPEIIDNADYTSIISRRHYSRILELVDDAREKGANIIEINPKGENFPGNAKRKIPLHLLTNVDDAMEVMNVEIFGPVMPIVPYSDFTEVIARINARPRPLAIYYFGHDDGERNLVIGHTWSGNVAINDVVAQGMRDEIPYGGVGSSGMGHYRGIDGFRNFSHAKPVYFQTDIEDALKPMRPPYTEGVRQFVDSLLATD